MGSPKRQGGPHFLEALLANAPKLLPTLTANSYGTNLEGAAGRTGPERASLSTLARRGVLPTLTIKGNYNRKGASLKSGDGLVTVLGGTLNPTWAEWFMGFPPGWSDPSAPIASCSAASSSTLNPYASTNPYAEDL